MSKRKTNKPTEKKPLRIWPGVVAAILLFLVKFIVPMVIPDTLPIVIFGGLIFSLIIIVWWVFFSRASWFDRISAIVLMIIALLAIKPFLHQSIAEAGMGLLFFILAIPILSLVFVAGIALSRNFSDGLRRVTLVVTILLAVGGWTLIRTAGLNNEGASEFAWRWVKSPEELMLEQASDEKVMLSSVTADADSGIVWPGFRGDKRDGIIQGVRIEKDWAAMPPTELWRKPIGPGWSSFAVSGNLFYTQEQRGEEETVSCYSLLTGDPVWRHGDKVRFWESNSGAGPRGTPTLKHGRVYSFGATGILNVLDANNGSIVWSRNVATETDTKVPYWGLSSSPLLVENIVIVAAASSLIGYDLNTGDPRWSVPDSGECYSSPHLLQIGGVAQVLLQNRVGAISVSPADGTLLWKHQWLGVPIVQPTKITNNDILISTNDRSGVRRLTIAQGANGWTSEERWTSDLVKPYFNDSVIHQGFVYGFDGRSLACVNIEDGTRKWKGGRYGRGQFILLADQDLLLVISEKGDLALVNAVPDQFTELARISAIKGKTWNHPVLIGDILLVRNAQEMAAFRLSLAGV